MKRIGLSFLFFIVIFSLCENNNDVFASNKQQQKEEMIFSKESKLLLVVKPTYRFSLEKKFKKIVVRRTITAYSINKHRTASGVLCRKGIVAANWLPLGTKIMIPKLFGSKVFVVADRMNIRYQSRLDVWMPEEKEALNFGVQTTEIIVL